MKLPVEDRFAIEDLYAAYSWALDTGDVEGLAAVFTPDGRLVEEVFEEPDVWEGRDAIRALANHYRNAAGFPGRQHHVTMPQYRMVDATHVNARAFAFVTECQGEPPMLLRFAGYYQDEIVKLDGEWLFASRLVRLWDGEILKNFPGRGTWTPRKRPPELVIKR